MTSRYHALLDSLEQHRRTPPSPRSRRAFRCSCGRPVFFRNNRCLGCGAPLGYVPSIGEMRALEAGDAPGTWQSAGTALVDGRRHRRCTNFDLPARCNWLVPVDDATPLCIACRLNRTIPDLDDADNRRYWHAIELAKRRLVAQVLFLDLPVAPKSVDPQKGLAFDLLRAAPGGPPVMTGHADGLITINVEEADDVQREQMRAAMNEPYRTLLGHFRHEIGHYYWDRLIRPSRWLEPFRTLFGDERTDYARAIRANYDNGPPVDWPDRHISAYASCHPWEDWAETWAHFLHTVDSLGTAVAHGLDADDIDMEFEPFGREALYDPNHPDADRTLLLINSWMEMIALLNEMARSLGQPDFYPFTLSRAVVKKLHFVSLVVAGLES